MSVDIRHAKNFEYVDGYAKEKNHEAGEHL